jgi:hypothetical protein
VSHRFLTAALALAVCRPANGSTVDPSLPVAEAYDHGSDFAGAWVGESNGVLGVLEVRALGPGPDYGKFTSDDKGMRFVVNMQQPRVAAPSGDITLPGNLVQFSGQDGRGGRGEGWVLINPADTALTGRSGPVAKPAPGHSSAAKPSRSRPACARRVSTASTVLAEEERYFFGAASWLILP